MADDITLKMNVDITDAQSAINLFQKTAEKAFKSSNASTQSMGNSLTKTANNIQGLVARMRELENTRVPTQQYTNLQNTIANLSTQAQQARKELEQMSKTRPLTDKYAGVSTKLEEVTKQLNKAKTELGRMNALGTTGGADWIKAKNDVAKYQQQVTYLQHALTGLEATGQKYEQSSAWDKQAKKVQVYEQSLQSAKNQMTLLQQNGGAFTSGVNTAEYQRLVNQLTYAVNQGSLLSQKINQSNINASSLVSTFKQFGTTISRAVSSVAGKLGSLGRTSHSTSLLHNKSWKSMLTTILKYGFGIRSIFLLYRKIRQVIKTGLTEMAKQFDDVRADVDGLKNSWSGFKASLVSAFQPIFSYVVPALTTLINYLTSAMNALANFFALLTGQGYYYKAKKGNESVANAISGTGSAAEDANEELAEYDDLLVIDTDDNSGGGGGGGGSSSGDAWNWEKVDVTASDWYEKLKKAFSNWDFTDIGIEIGEKLSNALKSIPWDTIYSYAGNFGKGLATFLNGLITTDLFSEVGSTIAKALNTAFNFLNTFGKTFDWTQFGTSIGEGITSFFTDADFGMWGDTVHTWIGGILDAGIALLENTDFELIGEKLGDFLESVQVDDLLSKVKTLCSNIITAIGKTLTGFKSNASEKTKLITAIGSILGVLAITKSVPLTITFAVAIAGFKIGEMYYESATGETVNQSFIDELGDIAEGMFGDNKIEFDLADAITFVWKDLGGQNNPELNVWQRLLYGTLSSMFAPAMVTAQYGKIIIDLKDLIELKWSNLSGKDQKTLSAWSPVQYFLKPALDSVFSIASLKKTIGRVIDLVDIIELKWDMSKVNEQLKDVGKNILEGIKTGMKLYLKTNPFVQAAEWLKEKIVDPICEKFGIESPAKKMYEYGKNIFLGIVEGFKDAMTSYGWLGLAGDLYNYFKNSSNSKMTGSASGKIGYDFTGNNSSTLTINTKMTGEAKNTKQLTNLINKYKDLATQASKGANGKYDSKLTGDMTSGSAIDDIRIKFTNLKSAWTNESATMSATLGGHITKISDLDTWKTTMSNTAKEWSKSNAEATLNAKTNINTVEGTGISGLLQKLTDTANTWKNTNPNSSFTVTFPSFGAGSNADKANNSRAEFAKKWVGTTAIFNATYSNASTSSQGYKDFANLWDNWYGRTAEFKVSYSGDVSDVTSLANKVVKKIYEALDQSGITVKKPVYFAKGGIANAPIVAGEAGKEAIIPLERNLGWMDKMATSITNKIVDMKLPDIVRGSLPTNPDFYKAEQEHNNNMENLLEAILIALTDKQDMPDVFVQLNGRTIAQAVADEQAKRNKQLGYI